VQAEGLSPDERNEKAQPKGMRVHLKKLKDGLKEDCDIMIDQVRSIDNKRLVRKVGKVDNETADKVRENLKIILDLD
jgi:mRNA interferase MazF